MGACRELTRMVSRWVGRRVYVVPVGGVVCLWGSGMSERMYYVRDPRDALLERLQRIEDDVRQINARIAKLIETLSTYLPGLDMVRV